MDMDSAALKTLDFIFLPVKMTSLRSRDIKLSGSVEGELFCENTGLTKNRKPKKVRL
jgi:hypothetical protein